MYYPIGIKVGSFDANFDPNSAWGGTWIRLNENRLLLPSDTPNVTGGSSTSGSHTLTASESGVPAHNHLTFAEAGYRKYGKDWGSETCAWSAYSSASYNISNNYTGNNTAKNATSGHTHPNINPPNRTYVVWYRVA